MRARCWSANRLLLLPEKRASGPTLVNLTEFTVRAPRLTKSMPLAGRIEKLKAEGERRRQAHQVAAAARPGRRLRAR
ncbi:hypothetical protein [Mycobacterium riyadhense]|uniref:hypothetical protein n=1 Tax=Mycobacterium riyadhense TaxID=486698 RepID=UPI001958EEE8|nr:hypothetical protein [Mycobacterium riyadhense]